MLQKLYNPFNRGFQKTKWAWQLTKRTRYKDVPNYGIKYIQTQVFTLFLAAKEKAIGENLYRCWDKRIDFLHNAHGTDEKHSSYF